MPDFASTLSVLVLAAGNSFRMGCHKALLPFRQDVTFIRHIVGVYQQAGLKKIGIVVNPDYSDSIRRELKHENSVCDFVINPHPERGRFYSVQCGLKNIDRNTGVFIQHCDMPGIDVVTIQLMMSQLKTDVVVLPQASGIAGHPVLIGSHVAGEVLNADYRETHFKNFIHTFPLVLVEVENTCITMNINTQEDYKRFIANA